MFQTIIYLLSKILFDDVYNNRLYFILYSENQCISELDKNCIFIDMKFH